MHTRSTLTILVAAVLVAGATVTAGQEEPQTDPNMELTELVEDISNDAARIFQSKVATKTPEKVAQDVTVASPTGGEADGNTGTITDFLSLLSLSLDPLSVSDDGKGVTLNLNPVKIFGGDIDFLFSATAVQPEIYSKLADELPEAARKEIEDQVLDDFSNLALSVKLGYARTATTWDQRRRLWGRDYERYEDLIAKLPTDGAAAVGKAWRFQSRDNMNTAEARIVAAGIKSSSDSKLVTDMTVKEAKDLYRSAFMSAEPSTESITDEQALLFVGIDLKLLNEQLEQEADDRATVLKALVSNQPQLTLEYAWSMRDELAGPDTWSASLSYEHGLHNFNTMLKYYRDSEHETDDERIRSAWDRIRRNKEYNEQQRFELSLTYRRTDAIDLSYDYSHLDDGGAGDGTKASGTPGLATFAAPQVDEWVARLEWSRLIGDTAKDSLAGRLELSLDLIAVEGDPTRQDRVVAKLGYTVPVGSGLSIPFTLSYANRPEFLDESDHQLTAHFGLSYKLVRKGT